MSAFRAEAVRQARRRVHDALGQAMEGKATDEFCLALGSWIDPAFRSGFREGFADTFERSVAVPTGFGLAAGEASLEGVGGGPPTLPVVLEFTPSEGPPRDTIDRSREARRRLTTEHVESVLADIRREEPGLFIHSEALLRQSRLRTLRETFERSSASVRDELERAGEEFVSGRRRELERSGAPPERLTEICWLNRTIRARTDPGALAEVAAADRVRRLDLPRRIHLELEVTARTLRVLAFHERTGRRGDGIIVAVIDGEVGRHPALTDRLVRQENHTFEPWGRPHWHATAVAGIIAAEDERLQGMAPGATLYNYKVASSNPHLDDGDDFDGALALQQALTDQAHIANCSWGTDAPADGSSRETRAVEEAWRSGMTVVKSAGNDGPDPGTVTVPGDAEGVIVVGACDRAGSRPAAYSARGPTGDGKERPHLLAPGGVEDDRIESSLAEGGFGPTRVPGTSFAAPHVAGIAALLLQSEPDLEPDEVRTRLLGLCRRLEGVAHGEQGAGVISLESPG